jgi:hypothetical protein
LGLLFLGGHAAARLDLVPFGLVHRAWFAGCGTTRERAKKLRRDSRSSLVVVGDF